MAKECLIRFDWAVKRLLRNKADYVVRDFHDVIQDHLDELMYYFKHTEIPDHFGALGLKEAREQFQYDKLSEDEQRDYDRHIHLTRYKQNVVDDSYAFGQFDGEAIGFEKGEAIGLEKGEAERTQLQAKLEALERNGSNGNPYCRIRAVTLPYKIAFLVVIYSIF